MMMSLLRSRRLALKARGLVTLVSDMAPEKEKTMENILKQVLEDIWLIHIQHHKQIGWWNGGPASASAGHGT